MPVAMQAKLLRVLEEGEVERIGSDKPTKVDVRVVVATHRNLESLVREGKFRQDLFHRIYVFPILLPPLRERKEEVPALVQHFAEQVCAQNSWKPVSFTPEAIEEMKAHSWPGNVRELRNLVERLILLSIGPEVTVDTVEQALPHPLTAQPSFAGSGTLAERAQGFEREVILAELKRHQYHVTNTAKTLGLERSHLYKKAEQLGIDLRSLRHEPGDAGGTT
jgi:DNA-binding NtrC family response regulator